MIDTRLASVAISLFLFPGCICVLPYGTGTPVAVVEQFTHREAGGEPLPSPIAEAVLGHGAPAIVLRFQVAESPHAADPTGVSDYLRSHLDRRRLPWMTPYTVLNGVPAVLGSPMTSDASTKTEFRTALLGLWISFANEGNLCTGVGWWEIGETGEDAEVYFLRGTLGEESPPVFQVRSIIGLDRHGRGSEVELPFVPSPEEAVAVLARDPESLQVLNILWLSPADRKAMHRTDGHADDTNTDLVHFLRPLSSSEPPPGKK